MADKQAILSLIGNPRQVDRELQQFRKAASVLSSDHPRLIDEFPKQWVAVYGGKVVTSASTFKALLALIDAQGIPRQRVILRFIDRNQRTMIL